MNAYLFNLFDKYNISERNRYEVMQIFSFLPDDKKRNLLNNFEKLMISISRIEERINFEKEVLLDKAAKEVEKVIIERQKDKSWVKTGLIDLKKEMEDVLKES